MIGGCGALVTGSLSAYASAVIAMDVAGAGEPMVLLHGLGTSRGVWRRVMPSLTETRLVAAVDLPGFGESDPPGRGFDLAAAADAVADGVAERLQSPFDLVGSSLGGAVALVLAERHPDLVRRLVLCAPAGFTPRPALLAAGAGRVGAATIAARRMVGPRVASSASARRILFWGAIAAPADLSDADALAMLEASHGATRIAEGLASALATDLRPSVVALDVPTGLIWGERDRIVSPGTLRSIRALVPDAPVRTIPGAAHIPHVERPDEFVAALSDVLGRLDG